MLKLAQRRVFYVEDDVSNRAIAQMILESQGAIVGFERWGASSTIPRLRKFMPIDVILLDLMFPGGITGYDVFDAIQREPDLMGIPVVAVSAADPAMEMNRVRDLGFSGFISKPVDMRRFPDQVAAVIAGETVWYAG